MRNIRTLEDSSRRLGRIIAGGLACCCAGCATAPSKPIADAGLDNFTEPSAAAPAQPLEQVFADNATEIERLSAGSGAGLDSGASSTLSANPADRSRQLDLPLDGATPRAPTPLDDSTRRSRPQQGPPADAASVLAATDDPTLERVSLERLAGEMAQRISKGAAGEDPLTRAVQLSLLDALSPGAADRALEADAALTPAEQAAVDAWRTSLRRVGESLRSQTLDAPALADAASALGESAWALEPLRITTAALAHRVEGFGRYSPLPTPLLAGRSHPVGLYVEVAGFTRAPGAGPDGDAGFVVELGEEVSLYHEPDGLLAWRRPEQMVRDFSLRKRRDFFLVDRLDLPSTLTVGSYRLKVRIADKASGASAEAIIPFDVVADRALAGTKR